MFKRRFKRRSFGRGRPLAKVRRDWTAIEIGACTGPLFIEAAACTGATDQIPGGFNANVSLPLILLPNSELRDTYSGSASLVRVVGKLYWGPSFFKQGATFPFCEAAAFPVEMRAGLAKGKGDGVTSPLDRVEFPFFNLAEGGFKHVWSELWTPRRDCIPIACNETTGTIVGTSPGDITGTISTATPCNSTEETNSQIVVTAGASAPLLVSQTLNWKGRMPLRNDEFASMALQWKAIGNTSTTPGDFSGVSIWGWFRVLVQF